MPTSSETWNLPVPPGFRGLREELPLVRYERHLPHWRQGGATYFVTFRLDDALPQIKLDYLKRLRLEWERKNPVPRSDRQWEELLHETMRLSEAWLDESYGKCRLRDRRASEVIEDAMHYFDVLEGSGREKIEGGSFEAESFGDGPEVHPTAEKAGAAQRAAPRSAEPRYELGCYVVMPNHVHLVVRPLEPEAFPLERILKSWKSFTARGINAMFGDSGALWQQESFDRIIRDEEHLWRTIQYIGKNPSRAKLSADEFRLWIRPSWQRLGWRFFLS